MITLGIAFLMAAAVTGLFAKGLWMVRSRSDRYLHMDDDMWLVGPREFEFAVCEPGSDPDVEQLLPAAYPGDRRRFCGSPGSYMLCPGRTYAPHVGGGSILDDVSACGQRARALSSRAARSKDDKE